MKTGPPSPPSRGATANPPNRFERLYLEPDPNRDPEEDAWSKTQILKDLTSTIISRNNSPDVMAEATVNPYRGCEHGCSYCYARPTHEYLGFSAGLDFETQILVKENAAKLLEAEITKPTYQPKPLGMSGVTDCYQPIERRLRLTRSCLEVLAKHRHPVFLVTKNQLITRDIDLLTELARHHATSVCLSITSLDPELRKNLEPRTSPPLARLAAIRALAAAGIPVGVLIAPVIPGLTDHELPSILSAAADAGASFSGYEMLRLPYAVAPLFEAWLDQHYPARREKVINQVRSVRGGKLYDSRFGFRMRGEGPLADRIERLFEVSARRAGLLNEGPELSVSSFKRPSGNQMELQFSGC